MIGRLALSASITIAAGCIVTGVSSQETAPSTLTLNNISLKPRPQEPGHYDAYANLKLHRVNLLCDVFLPIFMNAGCQESDEVMAKLPEQIKKLSDDLELASEKYEHQ